MGYEGDGQDDETLEEGLETAIKKEAVINLQDLKRGDGIITLSKAQAGLLQTILRSIDSDKDYRDLLMKADFLTVNEADRAASAIAWAKRYGVSIAPILDKIAARCAIKARRVEQTLEGLTSIRFQPYNKYGKKNEYKSDSKSPISR